jgi:Flp pilus assembly protein TadG
MFGRFRKDRRGNIAVIFAIALLPILSFVGAAIDYSRANRAKSSMQAAMDSAALMVSKDLSQGLITSDKVNETAKSYFTGLYTDAEASVPTFNATYTQGNTITGSKIQITASGSIMTDFMKIAGFPTMSFNSSSTASWGASLLRIALVLDNTGSMASSGKMAALQPAAKNLVTQLSALAKNPGDVYISVVPFALDVNVDKSNVGASWLRWDVWDPSISTNNCTATRKPESNTAGEMSWTTCIQHAIYVPGAGYAWNHTLATPAPSHTKWHGCVADRDQPYDVDSTAPSSLATNFIADQDPNCPTTPILPLTYNWTTVNATIDAMTPHGGTNQTIGLQWGWLSLLQQAPLNAPAEPSGTGVTYQHIIILFTDGLNTADRFSGDFNDPAPVVDAKMGTLCDNAKKSGVQIFTVQIDTDGAGQSPVLPACASGPGNFFMLTDASQINAAFKQIGTSIAKLRVAM